jgi:hypothetical protein
VALRSKACVSAADRLLGLRVRILVGTWLSVSCECFGLSGGGVCDGPIPRPGEFHYARARVCVCVCVCV